jgi:hypothetical protein
MGGSLSVMGRPAGGQDHHLLLIPKLRTRRETLPDELHGLCILPIILRRDKIKKDEAGRSCGMEVHAGFL